ncbi:DMT family transporter [Fictibacillus barbaricus]|uniref:DMT family transporter n=1 Tax=Fictibacillus barbaricus TaxID=182136 RepID=A0ABS2ZGT7_9BACL|nr:DMT family transporter [Fictibacillus barbaricus]MBN3546534.1 DMT family transporter [Fictibacillus barbaricus]GGB41770.1 membrane protein [Fictibacillus barbaricus]
MIIVLILFALIAGMALPTQFSINAQLRSLVGSPILASTISFIVGSIALLIMTFFNQGIKFNKNWVEAPWWIWTGGLLGAFYVVATIILIPRIGAASTVAFILTGQIIASVLIDHFGLLGVHIQPVNLYKFIGVSLIIFGVIFVQKH